MPFEWGEYLDLARELAAQSSGSSTEEARLRSAISRAYYAAFKKAFNHLCTKDPALKFDRQDAHCMVYDKFRYAPDIAWQDIGANLDRLRTLRNHADYDNQMDRLPADTQKAIAYAEHVISVLMTLT